VLFVQPAAGSSGNIYNVSAGLPYASTFILGGSPGASSASVVNLTGDGTAATVTLSNSSAVVTGGGLGTVTITGNEVVNLKNGAGAITIDGTPGQQDSFSATPTGKNTASVQDNGLSPVVNVTTTGAFTITGNQGDQDKVTVNGTAGADTIGVALGSPTVVTVNSLLPVNVTTPAATDLSLVIAKGLGNDTVNVSGSGGPAYFQVNGNAPSFADTLNVTTTTTGASTVTPGTTADSGTVTTPDSTTVFQGIGVVSVGATSFASSLTVFGTDGNDTITASADPANGNASTVWVNGRAPVVFTGFGALTLNSGHGNDRIIVTPTDFPAVAVTVQGGDPHASDALVVNGTSAADTVAYTPASTNSGSMTVDTAAPLTFSAITGVTFNGQGGGDTLTVNGTSGADAIGVTLSKQVDSGSVLVNSLVPLAYTNLGSAASAQFGQVGLGAVLIHGNGGADSITYTGHAGDTGDIFNVAADGTITSDGFPGLYTPVTPSNTAGAANSLVLFLQPAAGSSGNIYNVSAGLTYASTFILGGSPGASSASTVNLTGDGTAASVTLGNSAAIVSGGLGTVTITGSEIVNLNDGAGTITVTGTKGQPSNLSVTPTSANSASVPDNGLGPLLNVTTASATSGSLVVAGTAGDVDTIQVNGTGGPDTITTALGTPTTTVTVVGSAGGLLPINVATPAGNTLALVVGSGNGKDTINVTGLGGPASLLTLGGSPAGGDTLGITTSVAGTTTVTAGSTPGTGTVTTPSGTVPFSGISNIIVTSNAVGSNTLVVNGTNGNDAISAQHTAAGDTVAINGQPVVTFTGYATLNINGQGGTDTFAISPVGLAVTSIVVNGVDPNAQGQLIVNGTAGSDAITFTPTAAAAGTVALTPSGGSAAAPVTFTNIAGVSINGQGGSDALTVAGTTGNDRFVVSPGSAVDSGTVQVNTLVPLSYQNLGSATSVMHGVIGTGEVLLQGNGGTDTLSYVGHDNSDIYTVAPTTGAITSVGTPGQFTPVIPTAIANLVLAGAGGSNVINISAPVSYTSVQILGGSPAMSSNAVANLSGNGTAVTVALSNSSAVTTSGGLGSVTITGTETVNLNNGAGTVTVTGTAGQTDSLVVNPVGTNSASVQDNGSSPLVNVITTATPNTGALTVAANPGDADSVTVNGTAAADTIGVALGNPTTTVTVDAFHRLELARGRRLERQRRDHGTAPERCRHGGDQQPAGRHLCGILHAEHQRRGGNGRVQHHARGHGGHVDHRQWLRPERQGAVDRQRHERRRRDHVQPHQCQRGERGDHAHGRDRTPAGLVHEHRRCDDQRPGRARGLGRYAHRRRHPGRRQVPGDAGQRRRFGHGAGQQPRAAELPGAGCRAIRQFRNGGQR
jgi:hypothetical protein